MTTWSSVQMPSRPAVEDPRMVNQLDPQVVVALEDRGRSTTQWTPIQRATR